MPTKNNYIIKSKQHSQQIQDLKSLDQEQAVADWQSGLYIDD